MGERTILITYKEGPKTLVSHGILEHSCRTVILPVEEIGYFLKHGASFDQQLGEYVMPEETPPQTQRQKTTPSIFI